VILDSSAIVAVVMRETGHERLVECLKRETSIGVGAPTLAETGIVLSVKLGVAGRTHLARFVEEASLEIIPFVDEHWSVAVDAFVRFGKGRHRPALNFGDCLTYATARLAGERLLCLSNEFAHTDLAVVD
jgi:ribonuclease VapC